VVGMPQLHWDCFACSFGFVSAYRYRGGLETYAVSDWIALM
jgi:hypothetical protein